MSETLTIILNWNNSKLTVDLINQFLDLDDNCDYCIVDNNSNTEEKDILLQFCESHDDCFIGTENEIYSLKTRSKFYCIFNDANHGYAKGNNVGARLGLTIGYSYFIFSNNDILLVEPVIVGLMKEVVADKKVVMVGPKIEDTIGNQQGPFVKERLRHNFILSLLFPVVIISKKLNFNFLGSLDNTQLKHKEDKLYRLMGCFFIIDAAAFKKLDLFDEKTFLYYEEAILSSKIFESGYKVGYKPELKVIHFDSMSTKMISNSLLQYSLESGRYYFKTYRNYNRFYLLLFAIGKIVINNFWLRVILLIRNVYSWIKR